MRPFEADIRQIRERARTAMADGAVTAGYRADAAQVAKILNDALATELVCVLRYKYHYFMAKGLAAEAIRDEFLEHANEEQEHADRLAARITQLNAKPEMNPASLTARSHSEYVEGHDLVSMIQEDLVAERIVIETYSEVIRWLGDADPTTSRLLREILENEEEHAEDLATLLESVGEGAPRRKAGA
jgi:bacterioferritin